MPTLAERIADLNREKYIYDKDGYYDAFKSATEEKLCAAMVMESLAQKLGQQELVYKDNQVVNTVDVGGGPGDSVKNYLKGAKHAPGHNVSLLDYNDEYAGPTGKARTNLAIAKTQANGPIKDFEVTQGDAFKIEDKRPLNKILNKPEHHFSLAFLSHLIYHTTPENVKPLIEDVTTNLLAKDGVAVLFHLEPTDKPRKSFQYFRAKYGVPSSKVDDRNISPTEVGNPPAEVEKACTAAGVPCHTGHFENHYYFAPMAEENWDRFKHPEQYKDIKDPKAWDNLLKLLFMPQRAVKEFAKDDGERRLAKFIDEARETILENSPDFATKGGYIDLAETVQLIGSKHASKETQQKLSNVFDGIKMELPHIATDAFLQWQRKGVENVRGAA